MTNKLYYKGIVWYLYQETLLPAVAPHYEISLSKQEAEHLLKVSGAYFIRFPSNFDCTSKKSFWYLIKDGEERLDNYKSKVRNQINKGINNCRVEKISADYVVSNADLQNTYDSLLRHQRKKRW